MKPALPSTEMPPPRPGWWGLVLLLFGLLAWGVWWYFDCKIRSLDAGSLP